MKRIILYMIVLLALPMTSARGIDVGRLIPAEVVWMDQSEKGTILRLDTGDYGVGDTVEQALENMKATASGTVFLDTADYLIVTESAESAVAEVAPYLKGSVRICRGDEMDFAAAAEYLATHRPKIRLKDWNPGVQLQILTENEKRFEII